MIKRLEHLLYKDRLRQLELFRLEKGKNAQGNLAVFIIDRRE